MSTTTQPTATPTIAGDPVPIYVTLADAAAAMGCSIQLAADLVEREEIRAVDFNGIVLVSVYDCRTLGGAL